MKIWHSSSRRSCEVLPSNEHKIHTSVTSHRQSTQLVGSQNGFVRVDQRGILDYKTLAQWDYVVTLQAPLVVAAEAAELTQRVLM